MGERKSRWSDPNKQAMLEELAALQLSASEIGTLLGTTRNSIIGRARRTGVNLWHPEKMERVGKMVGARLVQWNQIPENNEFRLKCLREWHHG